MKIFKCRIDDDCVQQSIDDWDEVIAMSAAEAAHKYALYDFEYCEGWCDSEQFVLVMDMKTKHITKHHASVELTPQFTMGPGEPVPPTDLEFEEVEHDEEGTPL